MASPKYPQQGISSRAVLDTANTNIDGTTGTIVTIYTGSSDGGDEIERIIISANGVTTAGMLRFFLYDGTGSVLVAQVPVPPTTPAYTFPQTPLWGAVVDFYQLLGGPLKIPSTSHVLKGTTQISETFRCVAQGRKYV